MAKNKRKSTITTICVTVFLAICLVINLVYFVGIRQFGEDKTYTNTYAVGLQETADGNSNYAIEVNYMANANGNGLEMFEVKFNFLTDEEKTATYSQGLQFVSNTSADSLDWTFYADETSSSEKVGGANGWYSGEWHYARYGTVTPDIDTATSFNYMSDNGYDRTWESTNPLTGDVSLKLEIGDDVFLVSPKYKDAPQLEANYFGSENGDYNFYLVFGYTEVYRYYSYYDYNYLSYLLYNAISSDAVRYGTSDVFTMQLADLFDYQILEDGQFVDVNNDNIDSVKEEIFNYYQIKVTKSENGARKASDSIFNCVQGNSNFNLTGDNSSEDYFYGRTVATLTLTDFELIHVFDNQHIALKLREAVAEELAPYKDSLVIKVSIDLDALSELGLVYFGFADDSGLEEFIVYKVVTVTNGVETEVAYA